MEDKLESVTRTKQPAESYNKEKIKAKRSKKRNT